MYPRAMRIVGFIAGFAFGLAAVPAAACSPAPGYRTPSNLELVEQAETIVLAQVVAGQLDFENEDPFESTVTIRPVAALKGPLPEGDIALKGMMLSRDAGPEYGMLSDPHEFVRAHPVSYVGGCIRYVFALGTTVLFFLRIDHEGLWAPVDDPFARWAEDVPGPDAPWVELVRLYLAALALPEGERTAYLAARRDALRTRADDPVAQLMAEDVARQLVVAPQRDDRGPFADQEPAATEAELAAEMRRLHQAGVEGVR